MVVIPQCASVAEIPEAIDQRIFECQQLKIPVLEWESKNISEEEKQKEI
jgi:hypothetical protein